MRAGTPHFFPLLPVLHLLCCLSEQCLLRTLATAKTRARRVSSAQAHPVRRFQCLDGRAAADRGTFSCRCCRAFGIPPSGHSCQAAYEQQDQGDTPVLHVIHSSPYSPPVVAQVSFSALNSIIFRDYATASLGRKFFSLFPGLGYAAGYKIAQRIYKFGGQPWFNDIITRNYKDYFTSSFGERNGKMMIQACAGRYVLASVRAILCQVHDVL